MILNIKPSNYVPDVAKMQLTKIVTRLLQECYQDCYEIVTKEKLYSLISQVNFILFDSI